MQDTAQSASLAMLIVDRLRAKGKSVSFAESCTGGRIAASLTAIPGASDVFHGSCVTYANEIKHDWLGVSLETLETQGAVSQACVSQMLAGIRQIARSDYALAISGIAGPTGGTPLKPVGTVYIGVAGPRGELIEHCHFAGSREEVQRQAAHHALQMLVAALK
jgi:nicotinamide-nucleotide amidase